MENDKKPKLIMLRKSKSDRVANFQVWETSDQRLLDIIEAQKFDSSSQSFNGLYKPLMRKGVSRIEHHVVKMMKTEKKSLIILPQSLVEEVLEFMHSSYQSGISVIFWYQCGVQ